MLLHALTPNYQKKKPTSMPAILAQCPGSLSKMLLDRSYAWKQDKQNMRAQVSPVWGIPDCSGLFHVVDCSALELSLVSFLFPPSSLSSSDISGCEGEQQPTLFCGNCWSTSFFAAFFRRRSEKVRSVQLKMSAVLDAMNQIFNFPETLEKIVFNSRVHEPSENRGTGSIPVDILDTPKEYIFYMDVPGLSKSDIQVTVENENTLVIRSNGKRKREDGEEEGCKYIRLERKAPQKLLRKFKLPDNCNVSSITAKCENGVLTVIVEKLPPPPKSKTVEVAIS